MAVKRVWHGWTTLENAEAYETLLRTFVFPSIEAKNIPGYLSIELLRKPAGDEIEFITIMTFDSLDSVKSFVGQDYETVYVPDRARAILKRFDLKSMHYDLIETRIYAKA
jgi:antibiotic biosynthesis monooxygenase (ABM) superfamily enzyme